MQSATLNSSGTAGSIDYPNAVANGDLLIAAVRIGDKTGASTITDNNNNGWQLVDRRAEFGNGNGDVLELWYAPNASNAPNPRPTLSIKSNVSATLRVVVAEYSRTLASGVLDQHATANRCQCHSRGQLWRDGTGERTGDWLHGEVENTTAFTPELAT